MTDQPEGTVLWNVASPLSDSTVLRCNVHLPPGGVAGGPYPALVERGCYSKQLYEEEYRPLTAHGFAVVLQDVRGRGDSDGEFRPIVQEAQDGYDTVEWVAAQDWCDGNVGLIGASYSGWTAWSAACLRPAHLRAIWANAPAGLLQRQEPSDTGVPLLPILGWLNLTAGKVLQGARSVNWHDVYRHLPLATMDARLGRPMAVWQEWLSHPYLDEHWARYRQERFDEVGVPAVLASGWWDSNVNATIAFHHGAVAAGRPQQHLLIGPWDHGQIGTVDRLGEVEFGESAKLDLLAERARWFQRFLTDDPAAVSDPAVRVFVTGVNRWIEPASWPPPAEPRRLHLHSAGDAAGAGGRLAEDAPGTQPPDVFRYDPQDPVVALGGDWDFYPYTAREGMSPSMAGEAFTNMSDLSARADVLSYLSSPADEPLELLGEPTMELHASSDARDTDWFVSLDAIDDEGRTLPLSTGQLRARFHAGLEAEDLLEPGRVYLFRVPMRPVAHVLGVGGRLRLLITSSRFPIYARNPNTGLPLDSLDASTVVATNTVLHDGRRPSALVLPVGRHV